MWDETKEHSNQLKHGIGFKEAVTAFFDVKSKTRMDEKHSTPDEIRFFLFGKVYNEVLTVRYTLVDHDIRIIGAGFWRKGEKIYYDHG